MYQNAFELSIYWIVSIMGKAAAHQLMYEGRALPHYALHDPLTWCVINDLQQCY